MLKVVHSFSTSFGILPIASPISSIQNHPLSLQFSVPEFSGTCTIKGKQYVKSLCKTSQIRHWNRKSRLAFKAWVMASSTTETESEITKPISVLFVCLGNICRSPAAEGVFRDIVKKRGIDSKFNIDSAGTINYHEGNMADPRMRAASMRRGIEITSISRPIRPSDFIEFDFILAMDKQNRDDIMDAFNRWKFKEPISEDAYKKVKLMCSYCTEHEETEVPDPYYGGPQGFEKVLDLLEDACQSLLESILAKNNN